MKIKIGLETHVQLNMISKAFCGCRNPVNLREEPEPNTLVCDTCMGLPGSKPRTNQAMLDAALKVSVALNCSLAKDTYFSRKTYFYPDLSKNFQITQYETPLAEKGWVKLGPKKIRIRRVHMEEDPSKIVHVGGLGGKYTLLDYNRAVIPLIEIVTDPDFSSPDEARDFLQKLTTILEYLGVYDSESRAVFKSDANISLSGGKRVEIKNITGTKEIEQALKFEIFRQKNVIKRGGRIVQSTRMWNPDTGATNELRLKETEEDYGYIYEPDLTSVEIRRDLIERIRKSLPELPDQKLTRFIRQYRLQPKVAEALILELDIADMFETIAKRVDPRLASSWITGYLKKTLNYHGLRLSQTKIKSEWIISLLKLFQKGKITDRNAELVIRTMVERDQAPDDIIRRGQFLRKEADQEIKEKIKQILDKNPKAVQDLKAGEEKTLHFLVGQAIRATGGQVSANDISKIILKILKE
jgi:aspartyl-tRNA(Asn)/glutamyl-tRNA(Gln) amidotransferase subunit B